LKGLKRKKKSRGAWLAVLLALAVGLPAPAQEGGTDGSFEETVAPEVDLSSFENEEGEPEQGSSDESSAKFPPGFREELDKALETGGEEDAATPLEDAGATRDLAKAAIKAFAWLCVVIALFLLFAYGLRKFGARNPLLAGSNLGSVVGRLYLAPRTCLHFVRMGGRVLVVGVTNNAIAPIAEFDAGELELDSESGEEAETDEPGQPRAGFLEHLWARRSRIQEPEEKPDAQDDDLTALREDIRRLQDQLKSVSGALDE
jgi:flagellar biogenesis protein FliO